MKMKRVPIYNPGIIIPVDGSNLIDSPVWVNTKSWYLLDAWELPSNNIPFIPGLKT